MSNLGTIEITGKSGTEYKFLLYAVGQRFKALGAVYVMLALETKGASPWYRYVYVGETGDLSTRFGSHHKQECFDKEGVDHIGVHLDSSEKSRKSKESDLLDAYVWPCND